MKTYFLTFAITVSSITTFLNAPAQQSIASLRVSDSKNLIAYVSDTHLPEAKNDRSTLSKINPKAVHEFKDAYTNVSDETWEELKNGFVATFTSNSVRTMNSYDKNGRWMYCIRYYDETNLPKDIRGTVKSNYYDYTITSVQEINMTRYNKRQIYLVRLAYGNDHKTIRVCDGEMEEIPL